jgi:iron complex outermembrane recepter protein
MNLAHLFMVVSLCYNSSFNILLAQNYAKTIQFNTIDPLESLVTGTLTDEKGAPIPFAATRVFKNSNGTTGALITGVQTDDSGNFMLKGLPIGNYELKCSAIGMSEKTLLIDITAENPIKKLGMITLTTASTQLNGLEIKEKRSETEYKSDRKVFNIESSLTAAGGSAIDAIKNVSGVTVDAEGNVALRGSENVKIWINGKPSALIGANGKADLTKIPANAIKSIEILTNPSAKQDADGSAGILNIVLKDSQKVGFNVQTTGNIGTNPALNTFNKFDGSITANYKVNKINVFGMLSGRNNITTANMGIDRKTITKDSVFYTNQTTSHLYPAKMLNARLGVEYNFNKFNSFNLSGTVVRSKKGENAHLQYDYLNQNLIPTALSLRSDDEKSNALAQDYNFTWNKWFKKEKRDFTLSGNRTSNRNEGHVLGIEQFFTPDKTSHLRDDFNQQIRFNTNSRNLILQGDFTEPLKKGRFEIGFRIADFRIDEQLFSDVLRNNQYVNDARYTVLFGFTERVYAGYGLFSGNLKQKWDYSMGLRVEQVNAASDLKHISRQVPLDYFQAYPSFSLTRQLANKGQLKLGYGKRINRPDYAMLHPITGINDRLNRRIGNPDLKPEFVHAFELTYLMINNRFTFNPTLFYRQMNDAIGRVVRYLPDPITGENIAYRMPMNLQNGVNYGLELNGTLNITKKWKMSSTVSIFEAKLNGKNLEAQLTNQTTVMNARFNSSFTLGKDWDIQIVGFYNSPNVLIQGTLAPVYYADFGLRKPIWNNKATLSFRLSDIFDTKRVDFTAFTPEYETKGRLKRESRMAYLGFTYSLNKSTQAAQRKRGMDVQEKRDESGL